MSEFLRILLPCTDCGDSTFDVLPCPGGCTSNCTECVRTSSPCICTCGALGLTFGTSTDDPFTWCYCETSLDHKSSDAPGDTVVVTQLFIYWDQTVLLEAGDDLTTIAQRVCDDPDATAIWRAFIPNDATNLHCPITSSDWVPIQWVTDDGLVYDLVNPGQGNHEIQWDIPTLHPGLEDEGIYDCPGTSPHVVLIEVVASCGARLLLCPVAITADNTITCPPFPQCCCATAGSSTIFFDACEGGTATLHVGVTVSTAVDCDCAEPDGLITVTSGAYSATFPFTDSVATSFPVPCPDDPFALSTQVDIYWTSSTATCDTVTCTCYGTQSFCLSLAGGFSNGPCS